MVSRLILLLWAGTITLTLLLGQVASLSPPIALLFILLLLAAGAIWLLQLRESGLSTVTTPLDLPLLLFTVVLIITSHFSIDPIRSYRLAWAWMACLSAFIIFVTFIRLGADPELYLTIVSIVLFLFVIFGYAELIPQLQNGGLRLNAVVHRLTGFSGSANILGIFLAFGALIQVDRLLRAHHLSFLSVGWLIAAAPILFFTRSRGGLLAIGVGIALLFLIHFTSRRKTGLNRREILRLVGLGVLGLLVLASSVAVLRPEGFSATGGVRLTLWQTALENWLARPLLGSGLDTFGTANLLRNRPVFNPLFLRAAHSLWLTLLSGTGLFGVAGAGLVIISAGRSVWTQRSELVAHALPVAATAAFLIHATLDTPDTRTLFLLGALAAVFPWPESHRPSLLRYFPVVLWGGLVVSGLVAFNATRHYEAGLDRAEAGRWAEAAHEFDRARHIGPYVDSASLLAAGLAHAASGNPTVAIDRFERLSTLEPGWPGHYVNLSALYRAAGRNGDAADALQIARQLAPDNEVIELNQTLFEGEIPAPLSSSDPDPFWGAAAAGNWNEARQLRGDLPARQPLADGILALSSGDLTAAEIYFSDATALYRTLEAELWRTWLTELNEPAPDLATATEDLLGHRTLVGISPNLVEVYPRTILTRRGLPIDLVPGVWCRVSHPTADLHLSILSQILERNHPLSDTQWIDSWRQGTHPEVEGLVGCNS